MNSWWTYKQDTGRTLQEEALVLVALWDTEEQGKILSVYDWEWW